MGFLEELETLGKSFLKWIYWFIALSLFTFIFGIREVVVLGKQMLLPLPGFESFAVMFFDKIKRDLLSQEIELIVTNPMEALWAQIGISFFLAFIATMPILLYNLIKYLLPAFTRKEKILAFKAIGPSIALFLLGCIFSYFLLIPATIEILYIYVASIGAASFFSVKEFISLVLMLVLAVGILFMLPVFMIFLSSLGVVEFSFWKENWRYSVLFFLVFAAIITPDGSGITMMILSIPLIALYISGYLISKKIVKSRSFNQ